MSLSSLKVLRRYEYVPLDRLTGVRGLTADQTQRFYQQGYLTTELGPQWQRTVLRHQAQPLAQSQSEAGVTETALLATDLAHSLLQTVSRVSPQQFAYTAYGHHPAENGLSRLLGFNGECPDEVTGHYPLGQGNRFFNPVLMRFNSPDELSPFDERAGVNTYVYCQNNPINFIDPSGNTPFKITANLAKSLNKGTNTHTTALIKNASRIKKKYSKISRTNNVDNKNKRNLALKELTDQPIENSLTPANGMQMTDAGLHELKTLPPKMMTTSIDKPVTKTEIYEGIYDLNHSKPGFKTVATTGEIENLRFLSDSIRDAGNSSIATRFAKQTKEQFLDIKKKKCRNVLH